MWRKSFAETKKICNFAGNSHYEEDNNNNTPGNICLKSVGNGYRLTG